MNLTPVELLGLMAACLTSGAYLPQVIHTWRTRSVEDLSLGMLTVTCLGLVLWIVYAWLAGALPVLVSSGVTLLLVGMVLGMRLRFRSPKR